MSKRFLLLLESRSVVLVTFCMVWLDCFRFSLFSYRDITCCYCSIAFSIILLAKFFSHGLHVLTRWCCSIELCHAALVSFCTKKEHHVLAVLLNFSKQNLTIKSKNLTIKSVNHFGRIYFAIATWLVLRPLFTNTMHVALLAL